MRIPQLVRVIETCSACPSQWDAWDADGVYYYIRYRFGQLTVRIGDAGSEPIYSETLGDRYDGVMDTVTMLAEISLL